MDELEALNMLLRAIGSSPVTTLESPHPDAANARTTLSRVRRQAQKRGWWFNIDYFVAFTPDPITGEVRIPDTITKVVFGNTNLVRRGTKLYDKVNQTYVFSGQLIADRIQYVTPWDEMPESLKEYVAYVSAAHFVRDELEDEAKVASYREEAAVAMMDVKKEDLEQGQYNTFNKSRVRKARVGVRPYGGTTTALFAGRNTYG